MHDELLAPYAALERRKGDLLARLGALTPAQRNFRPDAGSWSTLQVAEHLALSEKEVVAILRKGLPEHRKRRTLKDRFAYHAVLAFMASPVKIKAPLKSILPPADLEMEEVAAEWEQIRRDLVAELDGVTDLGEPIIAHPVAGPADARQTLRFLTAHFDHHLRQVRRIRAHRDFPAADAAA